jgi:hypothetical protein
MSAGLADLDPYYDLDLRAVALPQTRVVEPPGRRFRYNNVNPILLGMVLERTTGASVSTYLAEQLWGPLGMEADGSWSLDSRRSGLELLQAGLNGRAVDFAKLGALYLHRGVWRGRQLVPRGWVADSTRVDTSTDPAPTFQYCWWTRPGPGPTQRLLGPGQPRPVRLRRPQPQSGRCPVRHRLQLRPPARAAGHPGPPPVSASFQLRAHQVGEARPAASKSGSCKEPSKAGCSGP